MVDLPFSLSDVYLNGKLGLFLVVFYVAVLGIEFRVVRVLGKCPPTRATPPVLLIFVVFHIDLMLLPGLPLIMTLEPMPPK
jgi:hypothetical protein